MATIKPRSALPVPTNKSETDNDKYSKMQNNAVPPTPKEFERRETDATHLLGRRESVENCQKRQDCAHPQEHTHKAHLPAVRRRRLMMTLSAQDSKSSWESLMRWTLFTLCLLVSTMSVAEGDDHVGLTNNNWERPGVMPKIAHLEVMCGNQHMEVHLAFDKPFQGLVTSKGMYGHADCIYVPPRTGKNQFVFNIYYDKCGTKPDNHGKFYENTIVVQYDEELIEAWDEAKRLRCEWFNDYEKTATKTSPMVISDLEIVELNFSGDNVDCWMEIQEGKGPWAAPLNGIAPLGSTLTMVIAVKDPSGEFDMRVKECDASDGHTGKSLALSDPEGCITRPKLLGKFSKVKLDDGRATVLTYAFISAFKFPDMINVHLRCTVEICRHGCPDHCTSQKKGNILGQYSANEPVASQSQSTGSKALPPPKTNSEESGENNGIEGPLPNQISNVKVVQDPLHNNHRFPVHNSGEIFNAQVPPQMRPPPPPLPHPHPQYGGRPQRAPRPQHLPPPPHHMNKFPPGLMRQRPDMNRFPHHGPPPMQMQQQPHPRFTGTIKHTVNPVGGIPQVDPKFAEEQQRHHNQVAQNLLMKPEPKKDEESLTDRSGEPSSSKEEAQIMQNDAPAETSKVDKNSGGESKEKVGNEREMLMEAQPLKDETPAPKLEVVKASEPTPTSTTAEALSTSFPKGPRNLRIRRSVSSSSDVIGVQGAFKVVSQADLNFALNSNATGATPTIVLRGKMSQGEAIYGICLPRVGFGVVFFGLGLATLVAILIAAFLAYAHYTVNHSKGNHSQEGMPSMQHVSMPLPYQINFPMVILRKMW